MLALAAPPAQAGPALSPTTQLPPACVQGADDGALGTDGRLRTFATCGGKRVFYLWTDGAGAHATPTPWANGNVAAVAGSTGWTWGVLVRCNSATTGGACGDTYTATLVGRDPRGRWSAPVTLTNALSGDLVLASANGRWWAVWDEQGGTFQARTWGTPIVRAAVSGLPNAHIALTLATDRAEAAYADTCCGSVWLATARDDGRWLPRPVAIAKTLVSKALDGPDCEPEQCSPHSGTPNPQPAVAVDGTTTYVAYNDGYEPTLATSVGVGFTTEAVPAPDVDAGAAGPIHVAAANDKVWVAWDENQTGLLFDGTWCALAERTSTGWSATRVGGAFMSNVQALNATSNGRAVLLYVDNAQKLLTVER